MFICHIFSIIKKHLGCIHFLAIGSNAAMNIEVRISFRDPYFTPFGINPEVELLDHMTLLFEFFWGVFIMFFIVVALIYISADSVQMFPFLHNLPNLFSFVFFILAILTDVRWDNSLHFPDVSNGTPLQYSCLENPMAAVHGVARVGHDWATSLSLSCIGEGNGNPLQCSCLENPRDYGAWWAAIYGVTQSRTRLKQLSSSSSSNTEHLFVCLLIVCFLCRNSYSFPVPIFKLDYYLIELYNLKIYF